MSHANRDTASGHGTEYELGSCSVRGRKITYFTHPPRTRQLSTQKHLGRIQWTEEGEDNLIEDLLRYQAEMELGSLKYMKKVLRWLRQIKTEVPRPSDRKTLKLKIMELRKRLEKFEDWLKVPGVVAGPIPWKPSIDANLYEQHMSKETLLEREWRKNGWVQYTGVAMLFYGFNSCAKFPEEEGGYDSEHPTVLEESSCSDQYENEEFYI